MGAPGGERPSWQFHDRRYSLGLSRRNGSRHWSRTPLLGTAHSWCVARSSWHFRNATHFRRGDLFSCRGLNILLGSPMSGDIRWAYRGAVQAVVGFALLILSIRNRRRQRGRRATPRDGATLIVVARERGTGDGRRAVDGSRQRRQDPERVHTRVALIRSRGRFSYAA